LPNANCQFEKKEGLLRLLVGSKNFPAPSSNWLSAIGIENVGVIAERL
jgi:hypothetical protein